MAKISAKKNGWAYALFGMCIGFFASYQIYAPADIARIIASYVVYPVVVMQQSCVDPLKNIMAHKRTLLELEQVVKELEQQKHELQAQLIAAQATHGYAQEVKELLEFRQRYTCSSAILAQVIMKNISDQAHFFLIDAGSHKGIVKDMVAVYQNHLVGRVVEVYPLYSKVVLITDRSCKVAAYCAQTKAIGIHAGYNHDDTCSLNYVSHLMQLQEGDIVLSSGEGLIFPRGFALGAISSYAINGLLYEITTKPLFDIRKINYCYVVQKGAEFGLKDGPAVHPESPHVVH